MLFFQIEEITNYLMGYLTMAMTKGLPYSIFIKQVLKEIMERGQLNQIKNKWATKRSCAPLLRTGKPLSFAKLITLFGVVLLGVVLALTVLLLEIFLNSIKPTKSPPYDEMVKIKLKHNIVALYDAIKNRDFQKNKAHEAMQQLLLEKIDKFLSELY